MSEIYSETYIVVRNPMPKYPIITPEGEDVTPEREADIIICKSFDDAVIEFTKDHHRTEIYCISAAIDGSNVKQIPEGEIWKRICEMNNII